MPLVCLYGVLEQGYCLSSLHRQILSFSPAVNSTVFIVGIADKMKMIQEVDDPRYRAEREILIVCLLLPVVKSLYSPFTISPHRLKKCIKKKERLIFFLIDLMSLLKTIS